MPESETRIILESQGPYVGITNQRLERSGRRGTIISWVNAGGGGDFFDPTEEQKRILQENGSPVIIYSGGKAEKPV